jgi:hypothetical protein
VMIFPLYKMRSGAFDSIRWAESATDATSSSVADPERARRIEGIPQIVAVRGVRIKRYLIQWIEQQCEAISAA